MHMKIDKIIAICGSALLGYYLGLSVFREMLWSILLKTLPPMNTRHTPMFYTNIIAAIIAASIGYLLYTKFVDKWSIRKYKKQYTIGIVALLILPIITIGSFRIHAVNIVKSAESTTPTSLHLRFEDPKVTFEISENSGVVFGKGIRLQNQEVLLETFGTALQQLVLLEASQQPKNSLNNYLGTLWIDYRPQGKWYSKILAWKKDGFEEATANQNFLLYKGVELEEVLEDFNTQLASLTNYVSGKILHTSFIDGDLHETEFLLEEDVQFLLTSIRDASKISPEVRVTSKFEEIYLGDQTISKADVNFYVFSLSNQSNAFNISGNSISLENIILYDNEEKIAWFEGDYYKTDLSPILVTKEL